MQSVRLASLLSVLVCLVNSAPHGYPHTYTVGFSRLAYQYQPYTSTIQVPSYNSYTYQQPLGYHSNAFYYPSHQNVVVWNPTPSQTVIGHSKENEGKIVTDDTVTLIGPATVPVQEIKSEDGGMAQPVGVQYLPPSPSAEAPAQHDAVVVENVNQQGFQQPSLQLQVPTFGQHQGQLFAPVQLPPFGFQPVQPGAYPTVGWIQNTQLGPPQQPAKELEAPPAKEDGKVDDEGGDAVVLDAVADDQDTVAIDGPPAGGDDDTTKDFETKISESDPEENEMRDTEMQPEADAPEVDEIKGDDEVVVAPDEKPDNTELDDATADDTVGEIDGDVEAQFDKEVEDS